MPRRMTLFMILLSVGPCIAPRNVIAQSTAAPPAVTEFHRQFVDAVRARDVDRWAQLVTDDIVMMAPSGRVVEGRDAFHELWTRTFAGRTGPNPLVVRIRESRVTGDLAVVRADYGPENADPVGQYVWLLERGRGDDWKLAWWIFNRVPAG